MTDNVLMCTKCNISLKTEYILDRHLQYWHYIDRGLPVCTFGNCKNRPNCNNKTKCGQHCIPEANVKVLTMVECKKIVKKPRVIKIKKQKKTVDVSNLIPDFEKLGF